MKDYQYVQIMGELSDEAYKSHDVGRTLNVEGNIFELLNIARTTSGMQAYLLQESGTWGYVFAFRGTELATQFWNDVILADGSMVLGMAPQQMKDALGFVHDMMTVRDADHGGLKYGINSGNTVFTGHSLGGSLAQMASYVYGFQAYTYNAFGVENMLWDVSDTSATDHPREMKVYVDDLTGETYLIDTVETLGEYLESLGVVPARANNSFNLVHRGYLVSDVVGGFGTTVLSNHVGEVQYVLDHTGSHNVFLGAHGIKAFNESISVYCNVMSLFSAETFDTLTNKLLPVGPADKKVEVLLSCLAELFKVPTQADHLALSQALAGYAINNNIANLVLTGLADKSYSDMMSLAADGKAHLYALLQLNPFVITGNDSIYSGVANLDAVYSDQFVEDRKQFLYYSMQNVLGNTRSATGQDIFYLDQGTDERAFETSGGGIWQHYFFGSDSSDPAINGGERNDHLHGLAGNDVLLGHADNDYLEGGSGQDSMDGGAGDDTFFVQGTDTDYDVFRGGPDTDKILGSKGNDTIRVHRFTGEDTVEVIDGREGIDVIAGTDGADIIDLTGTTLDGIERIEGGKYADTILGSMGNDTIHGGDGGDVITGNKGDDLLVGGPGRDVYVYAEGDGHDTIVDSGDNLIQLRLADGSIVPVGDFLQKDASTWESADGRMRLVHDATWKILMPGGGSIDLGADFAEGDHGIRLINPSSTTLTLTGTANYDEVGVDMYGANQADWELGFWSGSLVLHLQQLPSTAPRMHITGGGAGII